MKILKKKTAKPARKKVVEAPEVEKAPAAPVVKRTVLDVKAIASVRIMHGGSAIISCDGVYETVEAAKVSIVIED